MTATVTTPQPFDGGAIAPYFISEAPTLILDPDPTVLEPEDPKATAPTGSQPDAGHSPKALMANRSAADL